MAEALAGAHRLHRGEKRSHMGSQLGDGYNSPGKGGHGNGEGWHLATAWTWLSEQVELLSSSDLA